MLTKEECEEALENAVDTKIIIKDWKILKKLIKEHFDPKPYTFEDLKEGMWVYDIKYNEFCRIYFIDGIYPHRSYSGGPCEDCEFEENRFYPPSKANEGK